MVPNRLEVGKQRQNLCRIIRQIHRFALFYLSTSTLPEACRLYCPSMPTMYVCMYGHHIKQSMDQPGKVANPARGQLNRENEYSPVSVRA